jgi:hypothetical protein
VPSCPSSPRAARPRDRAPRRPTDSTNLIRLPDPTAPDRPTDPTGPTGPTDPTGPGDPAGSTFGGRTGHVRELHAREREAGDLDGRDLDALELVAAQIDTALGDDTAFSDDPADHPTPLLVGAVLDTGRSALMVKPAAGHPVDELLCFVAPDDWSCVGVASGAWASTFDPRRPHRPRPSNIDRRRVRLVHLVARSGASVNILREAGAEPVVERRPSAPIVDHGMIDDCCRRALGLATAAAPADSRELWVCAWLDRVLAEAAAGRLRGAAWPDIACLHPAYDLVAAEGQPALAAWVVEHLVRAGELLTERYSWREVQRLSERGAGPVRVPPAVAAWMDTGMFARTALSSYPDLDDTLLDLDALLDAAAYRRLVEALEAWRILT